MNPIRQFESIEGWIELGAYTEAAEELHNLPPSLKSSVEFCRLWIRIYVATDHWPEVETMCQTLLKHAPEDQMALINMAESLHRQGRSADAILFLGARKLQTDASNLYNMARYLCGNQQFTDALEVLGLAFDRDKKLRMRALNDPELEKVWLDLQDD